MAFRGLLYGYWSPEESLDTGKYGFGFQAASDDASSADRDLVAGSLLYEPLDKAPTGVDPTAMPTSLVYSVGPLGTLGLAAGAYKGVGYDGRLGASVTHALLTDDESDFRHLRPAQLFGSSIWRAEAEPLKRLPVLAPPLPAGPGFDLDELRDFAIAQPGGTEFLSRLLTAVAPAEGEARKRLMLLTADPARACRWIALVTSLLPTHQALEVSFRVHVNDLSGALERILVLHPWSRAFQGDVLDRAGYAGFDVDAGASNQPTGPSAEFWVSAFLKNETSDVQEAIELAARIGDFAAARETALRVVTSDPIRNRESAQAALLVMRALDVELFTDIGQELIDLLGAAVRLELVTAVELAAALQKLVALGAGDQCDGLRRAVLDGLLPEQDIPDLVAQVQRGDSGRWASNQARAGAAAEFSRTAAELSAHGLSGAMVVAGRLDLPGDDDAVRGVIERFAGVLVSQPACYPTADGWLARPEVERRATGLLEERLSHDRDAILGIDRDDWRFALAIVAAAPARFPRLGVALARQQIGQLRAEDRRRLINETSSYAPADAWETLWGLTPASSSDIRIWLSLYPGLARDQQATNWALRTVGRNRPRGLDRFDVALLSDLYRLGATPPSEWRALVHSAGRLDAMLRQTGPGVVSGSAGKYLAGVIEPDIYPARAADIAVAVTSTDSPEFVVEFVKQANNHLMLERLLSELRQRFTGKPTPVAKILTVLAQTFGPGDPTGDDVLSLVRELTRKEFAPDMQQADSALLGTGWEQPWADVKAASATGAGLGKVLGSIRRLGSRKRI
jgi:hypothetical protein